MFEIQCFLISLCDWQGIKRSRSPSPPPAAHYPSSHYPGQFASTSSYSGGSHGPIKQEPYVAASEYGKIPKTGKCCGRFCCPSFVTVSLVFIFLCVTLIFTFSVGFSKLYSQVIIHLDVHANCAIVGGDQVAYFLVCIRCRVQYKCGCLCSTHFGRSWLFLIRRSVLHQY